MIRKFIPLAALLLMAVACQQASATTVLFNGSVTSGGNPVALLGNIVTPVSFSIELDIPDAPGPAGGIVGIGLNFDGAALQPVTGGMVTLNEDGMNDTINYQVNTFDGGTSGLAIFGFEGDFITDTMINQANLESVIGESATFTWIDLTNGGVYQGAITSVPEPSTGLAALGLVAGIGFIRRRRR